MGCTHENDICEGVEDSRTGQSEKLNWGAIATQASTNPEQLGRWPFRLELNQSKGAGTLYRAY